MSTKSIKRVKEKRKKRVRSKIHGTAQRPRLSVFRSAKHIYVQAIDDDSGNTLSAASTVSLDVRESCASIKKTEAAKQVGKTIAQKLKSAGVEAVVFDRGMYLYHGRVKLLAESAREAGLKF